jgi:trk system potassium uptake protein TrkH
MSGEAVRLKRLDRFAAALGGLAFVTLLLNFGFPDLGLPARPMLLWTAILPTALFLESLARLLIVRDPWRYLRTHPIRYLTLLVIVLELSGVASWSLELGDSRLSAVVGQIYLCVFLLAHLVTWGKGAILANRWLSNLRIPVLLLPAVSFGTAILGGALILWMPGMRRQDIGFLDSLFTATSAVCVTGLTVFDIGTALTPVGQTVLVLLIQVGGIGTLAILGMLTFWASGRLSIGERAAFSELLGGKQLQDTRRIVGTVMKVTLSVEAVGAFLLWAALRGRTPHPLPTALFHAVSAFCNAGFSLYSDSLSGYSSDYLVLGVIMALIVFGGLGFAAIADLWSIGLSRIVPWRKSRAPAPTTVFALAISAALILAGALLFLADGWLGGIDRSFSAAFFQSVTLRTAGFQIESQRVFGWLGLGGCLFLMAVGASPQSTGGGLKTTVFARLFLRIDSRERESRGVGFFRLQSFRIALLLAGVYLTIAVGGGLLIAWTDGLAPVDALFESFSALGTVGLSRDITPALTVPAKIAVMLLMFTGRVLFPSFVAGIVRSRRPQDGDADWA